jgi:hypothetical protein
LESAHGWTTLQCQINLSSTRVWIIFQWNTTN